MRVLITGPPCAGKSTLAEQIAGVTGAQVVDFDEIARDLGSIGWDHSDEIRAVAHAEVARRMEGLNGDAVVIRSAPVGSDRDEWASRIEADEVIILDVSADEAKRRAVEGGRPEWTADAIDRWRSRYEPPPLSVLHTRRVLL